MSEKENDKVVVLELPAYVKGAERLACTVADKLGWVQCQLAPSALSKSAHVLIGEGGLCIKRAWFDLIQPGLRWDRLHLLARRGFVVNYTNSEFGLGSEPYSDKVPDMPYTPESQTEEGQLQRRVNLTPEQWAKFNKPSIIVTRRG